MAKAKCLIIILLLLLFVLPAYGLKVRTGQSVGVAEDEVVDDDLVVFAREVNIKGKIVGNVYAFAQRVNIAGEVSGSIFSGAANIDIETRQVNTIVAAGSDIEVSGFITRNVVLFGGLLSINKDAKIEKDLRVYGGQLNVRGVINGEIKGGVDEFNMEGKSGNVNIEAKEVVIMSEAQIAGDLIIKGKKEPVIEDGAKITGKKIFEPTKREAKAFKGFVPLIATFVAFMKLIAIIAKIIVGIIIIALSKKFTRRIMDTLITTPWKSLLWGFLGLIAIPVAVVILFIVLIGFPLAIYGLLIYLILFYLCSIFVGLVMGEKIIQLFKKEGAISQYLSFIVGILVLFVLGLIPVFGFIIKIFILLFGAGMLLVGLWNLIKEAKEKELI